MLSEWLHVPQGGERLIMSEATKESGDTRGPASCESYCHDTDAYNFMQPVSIAHLAGSLLKTPVQ